MFHKTAKSRLAEETLAKGKAGDVIAAKQMQALLNLDCDDSTCRGWQIVATVIPRVERDHQLFWRWDRDNKLWKCLTNEEKPSFLQKGVRKMHRHAKRSSGMASTVDYDKLDPDERKAAAISATIFAVVGMVTSTPARKSLQHLADSTPAHVDEAAVLRLFIK